MLMSCVFYFLIQEVLSNISPEETLCVAIFYHQVYISQGKAFPVLCIAVLPRNEMFRLQVLITHPFVYIKNFKVGKNERQRSYDFN